MSRPVVAALTATLCALTLTACASGGIFMQPQRQYSSNDPNRPPEPVPDLPEHDPAAVALELRTRMVTELNAILADVPQPIDGSSFYIIENDTGRLAELSISFGAPAHSIGETYARAFDKAAVAHGWTPAGNIGWTNLRKGPYFLSGGDGAYGVTYDMDTSPLTVDVKLGRPGERPVPGVLIKKAPDVHESVRPKPHRTLIGNDVQAGVLGLPLVSPLFTPSRHVHVLRAGAVGDVAHVEERAPGWVRRRHDA